MTSKGIIESTDIELNTPTTYTAEEVANLELLGVIFKTADGYVDRNRNHMNISIIKDLNFRFNINLSCLVSECNEVAKSNKIKKVFCMTDRSYNIYKENGLIVTKQGKEYYRLYENDLWLINRL